MYFHWVTALVLVSWIDSTIKSIALWFLWTVRSKAITALINLRPQRKPGETKLNKLSTPKQQDFLNYALEKARHDSFLILELSFCQGREKLEPTEFKHTYNRVYSLALGSMCAMALQFLAQLERTCHWQRGNSLSWSEIIHYGAW